MATVVRVLSNWAWDLEAASSNSPAVRLWLFVAVVALASAALLIPIGLIFDRSIAGLRRHIEAAASTDQGLTMSPRRAAANWFRPIARAFVGVVDHFQQRERALRNQLGELEIRHRVSEAERRQIEAVLHALRDAVLVTDAFNEIVMAYQAAATILGFDRKSAI